MNRTLYSILVILAMFSSCSDDEYGTLTAEQERLIGKAVNFNTSIAEPFATKSPSIGSIPMIMVPPSTLTQKATECIAIRQKT